MSSLHDNSIIILDTAWNNSQNIWDVLEMHKSKDSVELSCQRGLSAIVHNKSN